MLEVCHVEMTEAAVARRRMGMARDGCACHVVAYETCVVCVGCAMLTHLHSGALRKRVLGGTGKEVSFYRGEPCGLCLTLVCGIDARW